MKNHKKSFLLGAIFGLVAPFIGIFAGLQVTPILGNVLMFPFLIISSIINQPFGEFSTPLLLFSFAISIVVWGVILILLARLKEKLFS